MEDICQEARGEFREKIRVSNKLLNDDGNDNNNNNINLSDQ